MEALQDRRNTSRIAVAQGMALRARASHILEVRLLDLSLSGARIAHLGLLRPGAPSLLEFPPVFGPLRLAAEITRSQVVGTQPNLVGKRQLCYETGLAFVNATAEQRAILAGILRRLTLAGSQESERLRFSGVALEGSLRLPARGEILEIAGAIAPAAPPGGKAGD